MARSNPFSTTNNPLAQGGWDEAFAQAFASYGPASPATSTNSSNSSGSSAGSQWVPPQSSFGALPLSANPGAMESQLALDGVPRTFRFTAHGSQAHLTVNPPGGPPLYRARSGETLTILTDGQDNPIATFEWPTGGHHAPPIIERFGRRIRATEFLRPVPNSPSVISCKKCESETDISIVE